VIAISRFRVIVSTEQGETIDEDHLAERFRAHLNLAGVRREELFHRSANRSPIRIHDLRATFVTLALANGRTEAWVCDRTGHRSSQMVNRYRRAARSASELNLGTLASMFRTIPEFSAMVPEASPTSANGGETPQTGQENLISQLIALGAVETAPLGSGVAIRGGSSPLSPTEAALNLAACNRFGSPHPAVRMDGPR
jgi:hypothetical protein